MFTWKRADKRYDIKNDMLLHRYLELYWYFLLSLYFNLYIYSPLLFALKYVESFTIRPQICWILIVCRVLYQSVKYVWYIFVFQFIVPSHLDYIMILMTWGFWLYCDHDYMVILTTWWFWLHGDPNYIVIMTTWWSWLRYDPVVYFCFSIYCTIAGRLLIPKDLQVVRITI
jgi:hypothetical protein